MNLFQRNGKPLQPLAREIREPFERVMLQRRVAPSGHKGPKREHIPPPGNAGAVSTAKPRWHVSATARACRCAFAEIAPRDFRHAALPPLMPATCAHAAQPP